MGSYSTDLPAGTAVHLATHGLPMPEPRHVADFLALPLDVFLVSAYRVVLDREPDAGGLSHYQRCLLRGSLTRIEVLGRLKLSPEGRRRGGALGGVMPAFFLAMVYRVPLAGPALAFAARLLAMPAHLQDRSGIERAALAGGAWMKR